MILRIKPSSLKGYITPYGTGQPRFDRFSSCLILAMTLYCPELIVNGIKMSSPEIAAFTDILKEGGIEPELRLKGISLRGEMDSISADLTGLTELLPILTVICATAKGACCLSVDGGDDAAKRLLRQCNDMAEALGADCFMLYDRMMIKRKYGPRIAGGIVDTAHDARLSGACAIAGLNCEDEISLNAPESINRIYPKFWQTYRTYGGDIYIKEAAIPAEGEEL